MEKPDLHAVRDVLIQRLGPDFARSASGNHDGYVSARVCLCFGSYASTSCLIILGCASTVLATTVRPGIGPLFVFYRESTWDTMAARLRFTAEV